MGLVSVFEQHPTNTISTVIHNVKNTDGLVLYYSSFQLHSKFSWFVAEGFLSAVAANQLKSKQT